MKTKTLSDKAYAKDRLKQLLPAKPKPKKEPFRHTHNYNYELEKDLKRMKGSALSNCEIY